MSDRIYEPPSIGDSTPDDILWFDDDDDFIYIKQRRRGQIVKGRSIAVFVDGACKGNGTPFARAAMGVFFGPDSRHNISQLLSSGPQTNQRAEIRSAISALKKVRQLVTVGTLDTKTVVLISDSSYLVNAITDYISRWLSNGWINARGYEVANKADFEELDFLIDVLEEDHGIYVKFWRVDRSENEDADDLATDALN